MGKGVKVGSVDKASRIPLKKAAGVGIIGSGAQEIYTAGNVFEVALKANRT